MSLFVTATGTEVGKTVTSALIALRYANRGPLAYWKPIATGADEGSDSEAVRRLVGHRVEILPEVYSFRPPIAPHDAARRARKSIDPERLFAELVAHATSDGDRAMIVEGIGGALVPLTENGYSVADFVRDLHLPCVVVAASGLGTINHTLLTLEALRRREVEIAGVVLNGPRHRDNRRTIARLGEVDVLAEVDPIRRLGRASAERAARGFDRRGKLKRFFD